MKGITKVISILLLGLSALILGACGGSGSSDNDTANATVTGSWADLTVASDSQQVTLSWTDKKDPDDSTSAYIIYWSDSAEVSKTAGNKIANVTSPYVHTGLTNGATYYYVVTRVAGGVEGEISYEVSAQPQASLPAAPARITVTAGDGEVTLGWPEIKSTGTGTGLKYNIYWSEISGFTKQTGTKIPNVTTSLTSGGPYSFTHNTRINGTPYYYFITAETTEGESEASRQVSAKPLKPIATVNYDAVTPVVNGIYASPTLVNAEAGNQQATIAWSAPADPDPANPGTVSQTYNLIWWTTDSTDTKTIGNLLSTSFTHLSLSNGTTYHYKVNAVMTATNNGTTITTKGPDSATVSVVPEAATPAVPAGLSAATGNQQVSLSWSKDRAGSTVTYNIYWSTDPSAAPANWAKISGITTNTFVHSGLITGKPYYYRVTAQIEGESDFSNIISATP